MSALLLRFSLFRGPPNLQLLPVLPLIFHSIQDEIPEASRPLVTRLYQLWLVLVLTLIINTVACIFILVSGGQDGGRDTGASIGFVYPTNHVLHINFLRV